MFKGHFKNLNAGALYTVTVLKDNTTILHLYLFS